MAGTNAKEDTCRCIAKRGCIDKQRQQLSAAVKVPKVYFATEVCEKSSFHVCKNTHVVT